MAIDTELIKRQVNLHNIAERLTTLKGKGAALSGACPKCGGEDRFVVYPQKWLCRNCHPVYGDAIELAMWYTGLPFLEAAGWLTNGNLPETGAPYQVGKPAATIKPLLSPPGELWQSRADAFTQWAAGQLWQPEGKAGLEYLAGRGLTESTIRGAGLGFNPHDLNDRADRWGVTDRATIWLPGAGIVIPWRIGGNLHRVNIRLLSPRMINDRETKYIGPAGWGGANPLFNADAITTSKPVLLVEGEICALTAQQEAGDLITPVATGAKDAGQAGKWIARLASAPMVLIALDAEPGKGDRAAETWLNLLPGNSRRWRPLLKDVNAMHTAGIDVRQWIQAGLPAKNWQAGYPITIQWQPTPGLAVPAGQWQLTADGNILAHYSDREQLAVCNWVMQAIAG